MIEEAKFKNNNSASLQDKFLSPVKKIFKEVLLRPSDVSSTSASKQKKSLLSSLKELLTPPSTNQNIFGLDIGTSSIKLVQIVRSKSGLELANLWIEEIPLSLEQDKNKAIATERLKEMISSHKIQGRIISSIGGHTVNIQAIKIPLMPEEEIAKAVAWEARDELSIDLKTTAIDYIVLGHTDKAGTKQIEVLVITVPRVIVSELVGAISELGLVPYAFEPPPLAVVEAFGQDELKAQGHVVGLLELGAGLANFSIIVDGVLHFTRNMPITCNALTQDIVDYCNVDLVTAEKLKNEYGLTGISEFSEADEGAHDNTRDQRLRVAQAMNFKLEKLVSSMDHTFKFYLHQLSNLTVSSFDKIMLSGGGALIKDFDKFISKRFMAPVEVVNPFKKIHINEAKFDRKYLDAISPRFTLSVGLALRKDGF